MGDRQASRHRQAFGLLIEKVGVATHYSVHFQGFNVLACVCQAGIHHLIIGSRDNNLKLWMVNPASQAVNIAPLCSRVEEVHNSPSKHHRYAVAGLLMCPKLENALHQDLK